MLKFICPECKCEQLEEIVSSAEVTTPINQLDEECDFEYDLHSQSIENGHVERYQCVYCGHMVVDEDDSVITDSAELVAWLKKQDYNQVDHEKS